MSSLRMKRFLLVLFTVVFIMTETLSLIPERVYAEVGSIAAGEDITYDKNGGVLASMGFDTSKMPDTYDPDSTTNPYGADVATLNEVNEVLFFNQAYAVRHPILDDYTYAGGTDLYGHNRKLNGEMDEFLRDPVDKQVDESKKFLCDYDFVNAVKLDVDGDGRDSAVAVLYTHYNALRSENGVNEDDYYDNNIYMRIYDPVSGRLSDPVSITEITQRRLIWAFEVQSQLQITAGDYDKDSVDEIAVYAPGKTASDKNRVMVFDLTDGKESQDPYAIKSWTNSWNYVLPDSEEEILPQHSYAPDRYNIYNNIDLTSGDADNDGIDDLIISYGASSTDYDPDKYTLSDKMPAGLEKAIERSVPSNSVLLYGSDTGQMLRDTQQISYGGQELIRVSFAFGDVDADGNEDMFISGQLREEQEENASRVLGRYIYDKDAGEMELEAIQNLYVVKGTQSGNDFYSSNGWDGNYYSSPLMKTNLAVGNPMGSGSEVKIYLDSVLYSYDGGSFEIADELEDDSTIPDSDEYKGSALFAGDKAIMGYLDDNQVPSAYYEFGADCANLTASASDQLLVSRVSVAQSNHSSGQDATTSILFTDDSGSLQRIDPIHRSSSEYIGVAGDDYVGSTIVAIVVDTDRDGLIAEYTGEHKIQYQDPAVLAVLASPPYFKDVAAYDENDMLVYLTTEYGTAAGATEGVEHTFSSEFGAFLNMEHGLTKSHFIGNVSTGWAREETWGWEKEREFEMSYETEGGEDAVVMYSIPNEVYMYKVTGVTVDDEGNFEEFTNTLAVTKPHKPVTQTLALEDYEEIQKRYSDILPDVSKYLTSTPGDPSSYPSSQNDLSDEAKSHIDWDTDHPIDYGEKWAGTAFGDGSITQSLSYSKETRDRYDNHLDGAFFETEIGWGWENEDLIFFHAVEAGLTFSFDQVWGDVASSIEGADCSGTIKNMPRSAKGYGYDFSWKLLKYNIKDKNCTFPVITYIVTDVTAPPELPDNIEQDFEASSDSEIALNWTYSKGDVQYFDIYRYQDFPIGGGDELIGSVAGSDYKIVKDEDGNTVKDKNGHVIREYSFTDKDLTADTKYQYRMKVRTARLPGESIFSPVIEARTDVGTKPNVSLSTSDLTIYPDRTYNIKASLDDDPDGYQGNISYQWQKYDKKSHKWEDLEGCDKQVLHFYNCAPKDAGTYRCRMNLIRKRESAPQYISTFTESCDVSFSLRSVQFGGIQVFEGSGNSKTNTGLYVNVRNSSGASQVKPTGVVVFNIEGPNGTIKVAGNIDEETGDVTISSIEDRIEDLGQNAFVDGGYVITCSYGGNAIFYPAESEEEYHYLRNIEESMFLSMKSSYYFGEDISETTGLFDYKAGDGGKITREDHTDKIREVRFYEVASDGINKTGEAVKSYNMAEKNAATVPLNKKLAYKAYVEVYVEGSGDPAASKVISTSRIPIQLDVKDKVTGSGDLLEFLTIDDVELSADIDPEAKNIETDSGNRSLVDFMLFKYYQQNGDYICDSDDIKKDKAKYKEQFINASYNASIILKSAANGDDAYWFYTPVYKSGRFMVVGNYYLVSAGPEDKTTGSVRMTSPDDITDFEDEGYVGGTKIVLKAEPNPGYEISKWIVDDCGNEKTYDGTETFSYTVRSQNTSGTGQVKITAVMKVKDNKVTFQSIGHGEITVQPAISSGDKVLAGTKLKFTAAPEDGWRFEEWRWTTLGGDNIISAGVTDSDGKNFKEFTMPDSSSEVYALFARDTVDILASDGLEVLYINNGGDPYHEEGELVKTEKGKNVPRGAEVIVRTKPGTVLAPGASFTVSATAGEGIIDVEHEQTMSQGREACRFTLPENAESCIVTADTAKGKYTVYADTEGVEFTISVDGVKMDGDTVEGITSGSQVDIKATPGRDKRISGWVINGEPKDLDETTYTCNITENMNVQVTMKDADEYSMTISASGGGTLEYIISDTEGNTYDPVYVGESGQGDPASIYQDESILFQSNEADDGYTLTSITVNGVKQDLNDGTFTISQVDEDIEVEATFSPNIYCEALVCENFRNESSSILSSSGGEIFDGDSLSAAKGRPLTFSIVVPDGALPCVRVVSKELDPDNYYTVDPLDVPEPEELDSGMKKYTFSTERITTDVKVLAADHDTMYISTPEDLTAYFKALSNGNSMDQPDGVLLNDIEVSGTYKPRSTDMYASFDGNGYTIEKLYFNNNNYPESLPYNGVFGTLHEGAEIKDVVFNELEVFIEGYVQPEYGLLTRKNYGTISGVSVIDAYFNITHDGGASNQRISAAGLAYENLGTIEHCMIRGLELRTDKGSLVNALAGGVVYNLKDETAGSVAEASMTGNYLELITKDIGDQYGDAEVMTENIVALNGESASHNGSFSSNFYKQTFASQDQYGTNVFTLTTDPSDEVKAESEVEDPEFARKLAYKMNEDIGSDVYGVSSDTEDGGVYILTRKDGQYLAPVKIDYQVSGRTTSVYTAPGSTHLADSDLFGESTYVVAWKIGDKAYRPGDLITVQGDMRVVGLTDDSDLNEYTAILSRYDESGTRLSIVYYKDINEAIQYAAENPPLVGVQMIQIIGNAKLTGDSITVHGTTTVTVQDGAALTISNGLQINNYGTLLVAPDGVVHKYGSLLNYGELHIYEGAKFYNYGSTFENQGTVTGREYITCKPHLYGEWVYEEAPDEEGNWLRTRTCSVCTNTDTEIVPADPDEEDVDHIEIESAPEKTRYEVGEEFSDSGLSVTAVLKDGRRAAVTDPELILKLDGKDEQKLKNGDVLNTAGSGKVIVKYGSLSVSYDITIVDITDLLTLTDQEGGPAEDQELEQGAAIILYASLKQQLPYQTRFTWEAEDSDVISVAPGEAGTACIVTAAGSGTAKVTVRVTDEDGSVIEQIKARTVEISVISHVTDIKMIGDDISIGKGKSQQIGISVTPGDATDKIDWSSSDEDVAVVDENGVVTGVGGGEAVVTVSANGLTDSRRVFVTEMAEDLILEPEKITMHIGDFDAVCARVSNPHANGEVVWTTSDPEKAAFYVKNDETGEMEYVDSVVTRLSADGTEHSDAYALVAGLAITPPNETVTVTASTETESGEVITDTCEITVKTSEDFVYITQNGARVSGEELMLDYADKYIQLGVESSEVEYDSFVWTTIDDNEDPVLKVSSTGKVTFLRAGTAAVKVTSVLTGESDICLITVIMKVEGVALSDSEVRLAVGKTYRLIAELVPEGASGKVLWSSADESIATVSKDGVITAVSAGTVTIKAEPDAEGTQPAYCEVEVYEEPEPDPEPQPVLATGVSISDEELTLEEGSWNLLEAELIPENAAGKIVWSSSDESVVKVSKNGKVTAVKAGTATITAAPSAGAEGAGSATCVVTVTEKPADPEPDPDPDPDPEPGPGPEPEPHFTKEITVTLSSDTFTYNGNIQIPKVTVMSGDTVLGADMTESSDQIILLYYDSESKAPGTYRVAVIARDLSYGFDEVSYKIEMKETSVKKLKKGKKRFKVTWEKVGKGYAAGYQVRYSLKKNMKKAKTKTVKGWKKGGLTVKKLKGGKKYYVQVRTYAAVNGIKYYTPWTKAKAVKTRK